MKTYQPTAKEITRKWHLVDAKDQVLGRLSTRVATLLMGKHKPTYSAHMDSGDYVVIVNADDIQVTGKKESQKLYRRHSGYPGGFREVTFAKMMDKDSRKVIQLAVSRMLPKNRLQAKRLTRMKVFVGSKHPFDDKLTHGSEK